MLNTHHNPVTIPLTNGMHAIVDAPWAPALCLFEWYVIRRRRSYYAHATIHFREYNGRLSMSRIVAQTPPDQICHHRNRNSLDNRSANLINMPRHQHQLLHRNSSLLIKYEIPQSHTL